MATHTRTFTANTSIPRRQPPIVIAADKFRCVAVGVPPEGRLTRLVVTQTDGTDVDFEVRVLTSKVPHPVGEHNAGTTAAVSSELFQVFGVQTATAGNSVARFFDHGYAYRNADGIDNTSQQYFLYLVISPNGASDVTTWEAAVTVVGGEP